MSPTFFLKRGLSLVRQERSCYLFLETSLGCLCEGSQVCTLHPHSLSGLTGELSQLSQHRMFLSNFNFIFN